MHGRLRDYINGCRCEECRKANRESARLHRQRAKTGEAKRHVPPKKERPTTAKMYEGKPALSEGWEIIGAHTDAEGCWLIAVKDPRDDGWRQIKVAVQGKATRKANYWASCKTVPCLMMGREKDPRIMQEHRPALWRAMMAALERLATSPTA